MLLKSKTLVIAPHPDDEVLGVGGTLLRLKEEGKKIAWLIITSINEENGWSKEQVQQREYEIKQVKEAFGFDSVFELNFSPTQLDQVPMSELVNAISDVFKIFEPEDIFVPHHSDVHTDHRVVFKAVVSCSKWFRYPFIKRVLAYEVLSETDFGLGLSKGFQPKVFINIESFLEKKLQIMDIYKSEIGIFPFPRSRDSIRALSMLRGSSSGFKSAEAFELLRERL